MLIAHLSDPHLCPPGELYQSVLDTRASFARALARAATFQPDLLILSGDIAEHGAPQEYALARDFLARFPAPILVTPGNHDDREAFRTGLSGLPNLIPLAASGRFTPSLTAPSVSSALMSPSPATTTASSPRTTPPGSTRPLPPCARHRRSS